jgi:hypothetical protein
MASTTAPTSEYEVYVCSLGCVVEQWVTERQRLGQQQRGADGEAVLLFRTTALTWFEHPLASLPCLAPCPDVPCSLAAAQVWRPH